MKVVLPLLIAILVMVALGVVILVMPPSRYTVQDGCSIDDVRVDGKSTRRFLGHMDLPSGPHRVSFIMDGARHERTVDVPDGEIYIHFRCSPPDVLVTE